MADTMTFDINYDVYTNLPDDNTGIVGVTYGAGAPICGEELNEVQELASRQISHYQSIITGLLGTSVTDKNTIFYSSYVFRSERYGAYQKYTCGSSGDGNIFLMYADKASGSKPKIIRARPSFVTPQTNGTYYVYVQMNENREVTSEDALYKDGYKGSFMQGNDAAMDTEDIKTVNNYIQHPIEKGSETKHEVSRRCMITYRVIVSKNTIESEDYLYFGEVTNTQSEKKFIPADNGQVLCLSGLRKKGNESFDVIINVNDWIWSDTESAYIASKTIEEATEYKIISPVVGLKLVSDSEQSITADEVSAMQDAYSCIDKVEFDEDNIMTAYCYDDAPEINITLSVKAV